MLFIVFKAGNNRYALAARRVQEIVPRVELRACPGAPDGIAGLCNLRGASVPVIDLCRLLNKSACAAHLSTRIILTPYRNPAGRRRVIGILAESVTETIRRQEADFAQAGLGGGPPALGKLTVDATDLVQQIDPGRLVPPEWEPLLFANDGKAA